MHDNTSSYVISTSRLATSGLDELKKEGRRFREAILMEEERKKDEIRMKEEQRVYAVDSSSLFSFDIPRPESLTDIQSTLNLLRLYRIFPSLDPELYYTNCFSYALGQSGAPNDKINVIISYLTSSILKSKT